MFSSSFSHRLNVVYVYVPLVRFSANVYYTNKAWYIDFTKLVVHVRIIIVWYTFNACIYCCLISTGFEFPVDFVSIVRKIFRTYFAILAHIYHHHFHETHRLDLHDGLNTLFLHFMVFVLEFSLLEPKEYSCMEELFIKLQAIAADAAKHPQSEDDLSAHGSAP